MTFTWPMANENPPTLADLDPVAHEAWKQDQMRLLREVMPEDAAREFRDRGLTWYDYCAGNR